MPSYEDIFRHTPIFILIFVGFILTFNRTLLMVFEKNKWIIANKYFENYQNNGEKALKYYKIKKNMLYFVTTIMIMYVFVFFVFFKELGDKPYYSYISYILVIILQYLIRNMLEISLAYKEHAFYFAQICAKISFQTNDEDLKKIYLILALEWYNKYLQKFLHMQFKNPDKIFDYIIMSYNITS
jgi:hypothetical protein